MLQVEDKIPFFRRIMENEFKFQLDWLSRAHRADYAERKDQLEKQLNDEFRARSERQELLIDLERRNRLGQAEADVKQALLAQREGFLQELRQALSVHLKDWLQSDEFLDKISQVEFQRVAGPTALEERFLSRFPKAKYQAQSIDGFILYDDAEGSRMDLTLPRWLERYDKTLSKTFQERVGV